jgi:hypothetical protein
MKEGGTASVKMSGSGRKRSSKWDLKEGSQMSFEDVEDNAWPGKAGIPFRDKESQCDWLPPEAAGGTRSKWLAMEPLPGRRGSRRVDNIDEDHSRTLKATYEDESYGTRMSPGLDEWRQQSFRNSPKNEYKRLRRFGYLLSMLTDTAISILVNVLFFSQLLLNLSGTYTQ